MIITRPVNTPSAWSERALAFETSWAAAGWSQESQEARFQAVLAATAPRTGERCLDYGSGTGAFSALLPADVGYLGYDTAHEMLRRARREHPARTFTGIHPRGQFDVVVVIGPFNLPGKGWSKEHTFHTLRHLWDTTSCRVLAASLYAGDDEQCLQYTEPELERAGRDFGLDVTVDRWRPNDLLMVARR